MQKTTKTYLVTLALILAQGFLPWAWQTKACPDSNGLDTIGPVEIKTDSLKSDSLSPKAIAERIKTLEVLLKTNERQARSWWYTWLALYGAGTVGQGTVAIVSEDKALRQDMWCGAGTTLLGMVGQWISPVKTTEAVATDDLERLLNMEERLRKQALVAVNGKGWHMHALSGTVNLASGLVTWLGFKRTFKDGLINFAMNTAITEVQIWTQPVRAKKDYRTYAQRYGLDAGLLSATNVRRNAPEWRAWVGGDRLYLAIAF